MLRLQDIWRQRSNVKQHSSVRCNPLVIFKEITQSLWTLNQTLSLWALMQYFIQWWSIIHIFIKFIKHSNIFAFIKNKDSWQTVILNNVSVCITVRKSSMKTNITTRNNTWHFRQINTKNLPHYTTKNPSYRISTNLNPDVCSVLSLEYRKWEDLGFRCELTIIQTPEEATHSHPPKGFFQKHKGKRTHYQCYHHQPKICPIYHQQNEKFYKMFRADSGIQPLHTTPNPKLTFADRIVQHTQSKEKVLSLWKKVTSG